MVSPLISRYTQLFCGLQFVNHLSLRDQTNIFVCTFLNIPNNEIRNVTLVASKFKKFLLVTH